MALSPMQINTAESFGRLKPKANRQLTETENQMDTDVWAVSVFSMAEKLKLEGTDKIAFLRAAKAYG